MCTWTWIINVEAPQKKEQKKLDRKKFLESGCQGEGSLIFIIVSWTVWLCCCRLTLNLHFLVGPHKKPLFGILQGELLFRGNYGFNKKCLDEEGGWYYQPISIFILTKIVSLVMISCPSNSILCDYFWWTLVKYFCVKMIGNNSGRWTEVLPGPGTGSWGSRSPLSLLWWWSWSGSPCCAWRCWHLWRRPHSGRTRPASCSETRQTSRQTPEDERVNKWLSPLHR